MVHSTDRSVDNIGVSGPTGIVTADANCGSEATGRPRWGTPVSTMWPSTSSTPDARQGWPETDYGSAVTNLRIRA